VRGGQDGGWKNGGRGTTDRFGNSDSTERSQDWQNSGRRTTDRFGNYDTDRQDGQGRNGGQQQRVTDRYGNEVTSSEGWNSNRYRTTARSSGTTDRYGRTSTTDRYNNNDDEYSDDHDNNNHHENNNNNNNHHDNNNGWPRQDDRERNPIAGVRTTTFRSEQSRRESWNRPTGSGAEGSSAALFGLVLITAQLVVFARM
jgi:hypothetical protein